MDRRRLLVARWVALSFVVPLVAAAGLAGCSPPSSSKAQTGSDAASGGRSAMVEPVDPLDLIDRVRSASSGHVRELLTLGVPDEVGASTSIAVDALVERRSGSIDAVVEIGADPGEWGPMTTWPDDLPRQIRVRVVGDQVWAAQGDRAADRPWRDVSAIGHADAIARVREVVDLADLLADAAAHHPAEPVGDGAAWRGTVAPEVIGEHETWMRAGAVGGVTRIAGGIPLEHLDGGFVYEVEQMADGGIRLSLWVDVERVAANLDEHLPDEHGLVCRVDQIWSDLDASVEILPPSRLQNETDPD